MHDTVSQVPLATLADDVRELVDSIQDVFYRVDAEDTIVAVSLSALATLGYARREDLLGRRASSLWAHPELRPAFLAALAERGELSDFEVDLVRGDGSVAHVATNVRVMRDAGGAAVGYQGIWRDVSARRRDQEALRHSEEKFAKVFLMFPDTITISRMRDGTILDVNPGFERATGWPRAEALGCSTVALDLWAVPAQRAAMVDALTRSGEVLDGEMLFRRRDGALRDGVYSARPIQIGGERCVVFVMRDVTDARAAQAELRRQEVRLRQALEGAELGTWDLDVPTGAVVVNDRWAEMLGYSRAEVLEPYSWWSERLHPDDAARCDDALEAHVEGRAPRYEAEFRLRHRDGRWIWVLAKGRVIERDEQGRPHRMCGTHLDVSERKRLEAERDAIEAQLRQSQKLEAIGQVAGGVAHDFNNLLTAQMSSIHLLADTPGLPAEAREVLADLEEATRAAADLTQQLLAFGRRQVLRRARVDVTAFVAGFLKILRRMLREDVRIAFDPAGPPRWIDADPSALQQVLLNLAINAQDAMPSGGVLTVAVDELEERDSAWPRRSDGSRGRFVRLTVSDTGHGMDDATRQRAFEPFFTTKPVGHGTGLGLASVYGIVKQHGGFVEVESAPGRGAAFRVHWPALDELGPPAAEPDREPTDGLTRGAGELVLLVEDAPLVRRTLHATLRRLGYEVAEATDAEAARRLCDALGARVKALLSDVVMPGESGVELARRLRRERPQLPVILMSGHSQDLALHGVPEGVRFLAKPIEPATLAAALAAAVQRGAER